MRLSEPTLRRLFRLSLWLKAANSTLETAAGISLAYVSHAFIQRFAEAVTAAELIEDPHDAVANMFRQFVATLSPASQSFAAYYLFTHGAVKLLMVLGVLANRTWAYPGFIVTMIGFIVYQLYKLGHEVTLGLVAITILDVAVLSLAWHEYRLIRQTKAAGM